MKPLRILVLDRNPERREELVALLQRAEHRVDAVSDGPSAAESLGGTGIDAVLLDLGTPGLDLPALRRAIFPADAGEPESLEAAERRHLARVLEHTGGNKRKAAHLLGISRSTLLNKVRKYRLILAILACYGLAGNPGLSAQGRPVPSGRVDSGTLSFDGHATAASSPPDRLRASAAASGSAESEVGSSPSKRCRRRVTSVDARLGKWIVPLNQFNSGPADYFS